MPDWELELLGATQEPAPADAARRCRRLMPSECRAKSSPRKQPIEAEEAADKEADLELQSDNPDPENVYDPDKGSTHS